MYLKLSWGRVSGFGLCVSHLDLGCWGLGLSIYRLKCSGLRDDLRVQGLFSWAECRCLCGYKRVFMIEGVPSSSGCMLCGRIRLQTIMRLNRSRFRAKRERLARFHNFHVKAKARIWPRLSYSRQDGPTAEFRIIVCEWNSCGCVPGLVFPPTSKSQTKLLKPNPKIWLFQYCSPSFLLLLRYYSQAYL